MIYLLKPHPDCVGIAVNDVRVQLSRHAGDLQRIWVEFDVRLSGSISLPAACPPGRADGLWQTTCFEMFVGTAGNPVYLEFNLSPSFQWAAYAFDSYRSAMADLPMCIAPGIEITSTTTDFWLAADISMPDVDLETARIGLSAVIEEANGTKSYWALAHAAGPPDFHHRDCFIATLPAPERA